MNELPYNYLHAYAYVYSVHAYWNTDKYSLQSAYSLLENFYFFNHYSKDIMVIGIIQFNYITSLGVLRLRHTLCLWSIGRTCSCCVVMRELCACVYQKSYSAIEVCHAIVNKSHLTMFILKMVTGRIKVNYITSFGLHWLFHTLCIQNISRLCSCYIHKYKEKFVIL